MTLKEFLDECRKIKIWDNSTGAIRTKNDHKNDKSYMCPVCAVCYYKTGKFYYNSSFFAAGQDIGLTNLQISKIGMSADNSGSKDNLPVMRNLLLKACSNEMDSNNSIKIK